MNLTQHFSLAELIDSQIAARRGIDNTPGAAIVANLRRVAETLELVRGLVSRPVTVSSGYRSPALNIAAGGSRSSAHLKGLAADINVTGIAARDLAKTIAKSSIAFDQLIYEGTWVHVGLSEGAPRREVLTAWFKPGGVTYTKGIS